MKNILKIILFTTSILAGCIARERGDVDWLPENLLSGYDDFLKSVDTIIMSTIPYDQMLTFGDYSYQDNKSCFYSKQ